MLGLPGASKPAQIRACFGKDGWLPAALGISHGNAHHDKQEGDGPQHLTDVYISSAFGYERPLKDLDQLLEHTLLINTSWQIPNDWPLLWHDVRVFAAFSLVHGLGDTRRPVNEVALQDWAWTVAALFKSAAVHKILSPGISITNRNFHDLKWRLLSIRTDGLEYLLSAPSIPDLLARKALLTDAWNRVQKVLEEAYPLGLEVYRDENGPVFVVPDLPNLLDLPNGAENNKTLREYILEAFRQGTVKSDARLAIQGELLPDLYPDSEPWKGLPAPQELPPIGKNWKDPGKLGHLEREVPLKSDPRWVQGHWKTVEIEFQGQKFVFQEEVCTVCGLRPQGWGAPDRIQHYEIRARRASGDKSAHCERDCKTCKAISRKVCDICEERRADRAKAWAEGASLPSEDRFKRGKPDTIWLDEVADKNRRLALIVGAFDLRHWLGGTLVRSLAVRTPGNQNGHTEEQVAKNPSFARIRRVWETTRRFWQDVAPTDAPPKDLEAFCKNNGLELKNLWEQPVSIAESLAGKVIDLAGPRLEIRGIPNRIQQDLGDYHAYELRFPQGVKMAVIWDVQEKRLITAENLIYIASLLGWSLPRPQKNEKEQDYRGRLHEEAAVFVRTKLEQSGAVVLEEPSHYAGKRREIGSFTPEEVKEISDSTYTPLIPILAEPRTFMALVPADKAVDVVLAIKAKYEREMGKVRNRLPLHLGVVYTDSHTPLRAVLDAGRRMLKQQVDTTVCEVKDVRKHSNNGGTLPQRFKDDATGQFAEWYEVDVEKDGHKMTWHIPAVMGDGQTEDHWYPYVFWQQDKDGKTDPGNATKQRTRYYQSPNPFDLDQNGNPQPGWLVHAGELQPGDAIYFTPATLDFQWLDRGGRRFEIAYGSDGRRRGTLRRPYLLDELEDLVQCWKLLAGDREKKIHRLSTTQLHAVRDLIENKRMEWFEKPEASLTDETFRHFCESVLQNAEWQTRPTESKFACLTHWAVTGLLADAVELFYHIMKQRPVGEEEGTP
ncbi:MAG: hypothetical protein D6802_03040 [Ardenticatenia bacterium]|nr:MAG: hypothetical protein D6802_03040 [Ardenticatenia bacterium]